MIRMNGAAAALLAVAAVSTPASAAILQGTISGDFEASFLIDSDYVFSPEQIDEAGGFFWMNASAVYADPTWRNHGAVIQFYRADAGGGFGITNETSTAFVFNAIGDQIFGGTVSTPLFRPGTWQLAGYDDPAQRYTVTLRIPGQTGGVPEPATWGLMILGFGAVGGAMRRRQSVSTKVRFA